MPRTLIVFGIIVPLAAILGYVLASPQDFSSWLWIGLVVCAISLPFVMRWHHPLLILSWNASINVFFLPGQPQLWMLFAAASLFLSASERLMTKQKTFLLAPSVVWPLLTLALVVLITAKLTGGIGLRSLGSGSFGGRRYVQIVGAIIGFFALVGKRIPIERSKTYVWGFFLSALTAMMSNLAYFLGPAFYFLYYLFPPEFALQQALAEYGMSPLLRLTGVTFAATSISYFMLARYGIRGLLDLTRPWRLIIFAAIFFLGLLGGFRSSLVNFMVLFAIQFFLEGLFRTRLFPALVLGLVLSGAALILWAEKLPLSVQRTLSFLPIHVDSVARADAESTAEWRLRMWKIMYPQVPQYLLLGKGCAIDPAEMYMMDEAVQRGLAYDFEATMVRQDYHSGPLTLLIPFGLPGAIAFLWFVLASLRVLYYNYRYSPPELKLINTLLFSLFLMRFIIFMTIYGMFAEDLLLFTGFVGLSISLNNGVRKPAPVTVPAMPEAALVGA